jgi:2-iminobutanoate/2-iminopropanoate deaminase
MIGFPKDDAMANQQIQPEELFQRKLDGHPLYSAVVVATGKKQIFIAGTVSRNKKGEIVGVGDMRAQIRQVAENLRISLKAAGATFKDLVKTTTYVTAIDEFFKYPDVRATIFGEAYPTSTTVEVRRLSQPELMVEIEAVAVVDE